MTDARKNQLASWAAKQLNQAEQSLSVVSGDASFRRYFRLPIADTYSNSSSTSNAEQSVIAVDSPPDKEPIEAFLRVASMFHAAGVNVPQVIAKDATQGFMLLSDFGDQLYLPQLKNGAEDALYSSAIDALVQLQVGCSDCQSQLPKYDSALLHREMELFREWFLMSHLGITLTDNEHSMLSDWFEQLSVNAQRQLQVAVHRDYHSRNLMIVPKHSPGVIDFQDAVEGPVTYDLISLLKDCYVVWPRAKQLDWLESYVEKATQKGLSVSFDEAFIRDYDWMGLQRHIKVAGIFCRLNHRDGKPGYMKDIALTLSYIVDVLVRYEEFDEIKAWFEKRLKPELINTQLMWRKLE
ncbi:aminoglycoside phosphotransferase family protein [Pleionea sediminis]|uniref:aminoglycoside phosphotransferase family protein n=1 Tax=Pleionea sediminis TaxID=2569479 RepID=UPI0011850509|nr:phosphotransferase [Pleionea sediminis]